MHLPDLIFIVCHLPPINLDGYRRLIPSRSSASFHDVGAVSPRLLNKYPEWLWWALYPLLSPDFSRPRFLSYILYSTLRTPGPLLARTLLSRIGTVSHSRPVFRSAASPYHRRSHTTSSSKSIYILLRLDFFDLVIKLSASFHRPWLPMVIVPLPPAASPLRAPRGLPLSLYKLQQP